MKYFYLKNTFITVKIKQPLGSTPRNIVWKKFVGHFYSQTCKTKKRLVNNVLTLQAIHSTAFSYRFFGFPGIYLYNKLNQRLSIYSSSKLHYKRTVLHWLKSLNYKDTEKLLYIPSWLNNTCEHVGSAFRFYSWIS